MKNSLITNALLLVCLAAGAVWAQEVRPSTEQVACPHPITVHLSGGPSGPAAPILSQFPANLRPLIGGSVWNQPGADKQFGHTFRFNPLTKECCAMTRGTLKLHLKALVSGPGNASSVNDGINVYVGGVQVAAATPWTSSVLAGATTTVPIPIAGNNLTSGFLSVYVQDDTAVVSAELDLTGCCVTRRP
jgi:hypothetical protein